MIGRYLAGSLNAPLKCIYNILRGILNLSILGVLIFALKILIACICCVYIYELCVILCVLIFEKGHFTKFFFYNLSEISGKKQWVNSFFRKIEVPYLQIL